MMHCVRSRSRRSGSSRSQPCMIVFTSFREEEFRRTVRGRREVRISGRKSRRTVTVRGDSARSLRVVQRIDELMFDSTATRRKAKCQNDQWMNRLV